MRVVSTLAVLVALASAFFLYALGYDTRRLEADLAARERAADQARSDIATLKAERAYLARPERIEPLARDKLQFLLDGISQNLGPSLLRVKGLVNVREEPGRPAIIQGAQHLLHTMTWLDHWPSADTRTRVVFITQGIAHDRLKEIIELLDRMSARTFIAREKARLAREAANQAQ